MGVSPIVVYVVSFQLQPFSTTMLVGERVNCSQIAEESSNALSTNEDMWHRSLPCHFLRFELQQAELDGKNPPEVGSKTNMVNPKNHWTWRGLTL